MAAAAFGKVAIAAAARVMTVGLSQATCHPSADVSSVPRCADGVPCRYPVMVSVARLSGWVYVVTGCPYGVLSAWVHPAGVSVWVGAARNTVPASVAVVVMGSVVRSVVSGCRCG